MLSDRERRALGDVERGTAAEDPAFADVLREGQKQLPVASRGTEHALVAPLTVLVIILLLMGQLAAAVITACIALGIGWLTSAYPGEGARR
jgi:hypothetical protein